MAFKLVIVTPKGLYFEQEVESLSVKLTTGYRTILAHHAPLIGALDYAPMHLVQEGKTTFYALHGGAIHVHKDGVTLIVNAIEREDEIDLERAKRAKERAENRLKSKDDNVDVKRAQLALYRALCRINTIDR